MVHELKRGIEEGKILFGIRQVLKNSKRLNKIIVADDCRKETLSLLDKCNLDIELSGFGKEDIANKLELDFKCEVFGLKK